MKGRIVCRPSSGALAMDTNLSFLKALVILVPAGMVCAGATIILMRKRTFSSILQLLGATGLVMVVLTHICEGLGLYPGMHWGDPASVGHFLDLISALIGMILFPIGYLLHSVTLRWTQARCGT